MMRRQQETAQNQPYLNRFIQPDSIVPDPSNPQAYNRYSYVYGNPLRYIDPSGHDPRCGPDGIYCGVDPTQATTGSLLGPQWNNNGGSKGNRAHRDSGEGGNYNSLNPPNAPDPTLLIPPLVGGGVCPTEYSLIQCSYSGNYYMPYGDINMDNDEFNKLLLAIFFDLKNRKPVGGYDFKNRSVYDTPLWDSYGDFKGRVCFNEDCYKRSEVNYVAQGMWVAASGQTLVEGQAGVWGWKSCSLIGICSRPVDANYWPPIPSSGTIYWFNAGYRIYNVLRSSYPPSSP